MENTLPEYGIRSAIVTVAELGAFLQQLRGISRTHEVAIVCFNAENMAGLRHAEAALVHALRSFSGGSPIARRLEMEALLYAAGTRQCADTTAFGIHEGRNRAYICCCPPRPGIWDALSHLLQFVDDVEDASDPEKSVRLRRLFSISDEEITAAGGESRLQDLVIERVALLDAYR